MFIIIMILPFGVLLLLFLSPQDYLDLDQLDSPVVSVDSQYSSMSSSSLASIQLLETQV
jgi:hypothetical protein